MKAIVLMGMAGSGKSTIGRALSDQTGCAYISTGDLARKIAGDWQEKGQFAPEVLMRSAFVQELHRLKGECNIVILDGMPRKPEQVAFLEQLFDKTVYYSIDIPERVAMKRLIERGRADDTRVAIIQRIANYYNTTWEAMVEAQRRGHKFTKLDGTRQPEHNIAAIIKEEELG